MTMDPRQNEYLRAKIAAEDHNPGNNSQKSHLQDSGQLYKNPRIVRVSRAFGGKDRHSKVCTLKGLRDRRIRLSAPTAIQVYDLQDRLGLSQPSKVVDWLLDNTKEEIDKLPPLPMIPQFHQPNEPLLPPNHPSLLYKDFMVDHNVKNNNQDNQDNKGFGGFMPQNLFALGNNHQGLAHQNVQLWEHSHGNNSTFSQFGGGYSLSSSQIIDDSHRTTNLNMANAVVIPSFPSYNVIPSSTENNAVVPTTLHLIGNSTMRSPFGFNVNYRSINSPRNDCERT